MPQPLDISDRFVTACAPVIGSTYPTCGTITKASLAYLTKNDLDELFKPGGKFADLQAWFQYTIEMKACGIKRNALYDWIMANADTTAYRAALNVSKGVKTPSFIYPFIFGRQMSVVNKDYWVLHGHAPFATYTADAPGEAIGALGQTSFSGPLGTLASSSSHVLRVTSRHGIPMDPAWFRDRDRIHVFNRSSGGVLQHGQWKVISSAVDTSLTYIDVEVISENAGSDQPYGATMATGVIIAGINNVNDYEKWCVDLPTIDPRKRVPYWIQTWRQSRCVDSEYEEVFARMMTSNPAFKEFGDLDLAERNRQDEEDNQRRFVNSFFFNKPISTSQTLVDWLNLESIESAVPTSNWSPGQGSKLQAKRANFVGVKEQLRVCDRVLDLQNNPLNLYEFLDRNYEIMRARHSAGMSTTEITWWTNSIFAANFTTAVMQYYKQETLEQFRITAQLNQVGELGWTFSRYEFKRPAGVKINILTDPFFDDWLDEMTAAGFESIGNLLLCLDIGKPGPSGGTIYYAQLAALRKAYTSAQIDELAKFDSSFKCVMKYPTTRQNLYSQTGTVIVECPLVSLWVENFNNVVPITTGKTANPSYLNLY